MGIFANLCFRGLLITKNLPNYFGVHRSIFKFGILLTIFHIFEFVCMAIPKSENITTTQFLLSPCPSKEYELAIFSIVFEFLFTSYLLPKFKFEICKYTDIFGLYLSLFGIMIRCIAIIQAGNNFHHTLNSTLSLKHQLVTSGVYKWCRHPSYVGWTLFVIGAQIMIGNLISLPLSIYVIFDFFYDRISQEEKVLLNTFKDEYQEYKINTPLGFPFIS